MSHETSARPGPPNIASAPVAGWTGGLKGLQARVHWAAAGLFAFTWVFRFLALSGFHNDHFVYLAPAQQMLAGELPIRDFVEPGTPLMHAVSAAARLVFESPLMAEAVVVSTALGLAAALTMYAAFFASGSLGIAVVVTIAEIALFPRAYHYPKLFVHAAGILAMWGYVRMPSVRRAWLLALCVVIAFLFRHDHGLLLGGAAVLTAACARSASDSGPRRVAQMAGMIGLLVLPYLLYVQTTIGLPEYFASGLAYSEAEADRTNLPWWVFDAIAGEAAAGTLAALFYLYHLLPLLALGVLGWRRIKGSPIQMGAPQILPLALLAIAANVTLLRSPLQARLPDVAVHACILAAWLVPQAWRVAGAWGVAARGVVVLGAGIAALGVNAVGGPAERLDRAGLLSRPDAVLAHARQQVSELQQPFSERQFPSRIAGALVPFFEYVGRCTTPDHRLLVAGDAPEVYVYARRLFAGGQPLLRHGFFSTEADQRRLLLRLRRQLVPLALVVTDADFGAFRLVMAEIERDFEPVLEIPVEGRASVQVRVSRHVRPRGVDAVTSLPCFTSPS
jgi:hypothetical protein